MAKTTKKYFDYTTIKSYEDACKKLQLDPKALPDVSMIPKKHRKAVIASYKLFIMFDAINDGWTPDWSNSDQYKYFPWLQIAADKKRPSGFGFSGTSYGFTDTRTDTGSRLCGDSRDKAIYVADTFQTELADLFLIQ